MQVQGQLLLQSGVIAGIARCVVLLLQLPLLAATVPTEDAPALSLEPAEQAVRSDGLRRYYHVHRWGTALPDGPVGAITGNASDDEADDGWRREESARRTRARAEVSAADARLAEAWNAHVAALKTRLVSDRMLPEACRLFVRAHAPELQRSASFHRSFRAHLRVMWEHNLLHRDDVQDCLVLVSALAQAGAKKGGSGSGGEAAVAVCSECTRPLHEAHCALAGRPRGAPAWTAGRLASPKRPPITAARVSEMPPIESSIS